LVATTKEASMPLPADLPGRDDITGTAINISCGAMFD
jgi:hypothetical protein